MTGVHALDHLVDLAPRMQGVRSSDLSPGDWLIIRTKNSVYLLSALGQDLYAVSGGWFTSHGADATAVGVRGCTWGRQAILTGFIAAPGMCIEFDNGVQTTRVHEVQVVRKSSVQ